MKKTLPIGVIDSGKGGKSVLFQMRKIMPNETYIYLADGKNAPYGNKTAEQILGYTENNVSFLMKYPCKAIVIACNTATAVAVKNIRAEYAEIPVVGVEPALRPAVRDFPGKNILLLATEVTIKENKLKELILSLGKEKTRGVVCLPVQKVVSYVDEGMESSDEIVSYLKGEFRNYRNVRFSACVLGCTHFPFARNAIVKALGYRPVFYDGGEGAAKRLKSLLEEKGLLLDNANGGLVAEINTKPK